MPKPYRPRDIHSKTKCDCGKCAPHWKCRYCGDIYGKCKDCHDAAVHCREPFDMQRKWKPGVKRAPSNRVFKGDLSHIRYGKVVERPVRLVRSSASMPTDREGTPQTLP